MKETLADMMYSPKYLESTTSFVLNSYKHFNYCPDAMSVALHSGGCVGYATVMSWRVHLNLFFPFADGKVLEEGDEGYNEALSLVRFKNYGEYKPLASGYSCIIFNNGSQLVFDEEGYAGDITVERLLELTHELEMSYDYNQ